MSRTKPTKNAPETAIASWGGVDTALAQIAENRRRIEEATAKADREMKAVKDRLADTVQPLKGIISGLEKDIESFTLTRQDELDGRSRKLNHGSVFLRLTSSIPAPKGKKKDEVVARIRKTFGRAASKYLKETVSISIDAMKELTDAQVKKLGLERNRADSFSYELASVDHKDTAPPDGGG